MPLEQPKPIEPPEKSDSREKSESRKNVPLSQEEQAEQKAVDDYSRAETAARNMKVENDIEYKQSSVSLAQGYIPYLESLLEEVKDKDEWFGDSAEEQQKEQTLLQQAAIAVRTNLDDLRTQLDAGTDREKASYRKLQSLYTERSARLTELLASVDENMENVELRDPDKAGQQAIETIVHMDSEQALDWVARMMSSIDDNNWQSKGLKETYGKLAMACRQGLQMVLAKEKNESLNDPAKAKNYIRHCMDAAKLFTDRGTPIDSDLTDIDFAVSMAKEAMGFDELSRRYIEHTFKQKSPIKEYLETHTSDALARLDDTLDEEARNKPQIQQMRSTLEASPADMQGLAEQYAILRTLETMFKQKDQPGLKVEQPNIDQELNENLYSWLEQSIEQFETFLNGTWKGAATLGDINAAIGDPPLSAEQTEAWKLLGDIQGYGYDIGDKTWSYVGAGAKIAAMIAAGVAVGIATGGLGIVAGALAGGAAMTATGAAINQQGFDNLSDAANVYGKDFAVNTATMGAARYLAAGRAAFQLGRAGLLQEAGGVSGLMRTAAQKGGMKIIGSLDDAAGIGTRLVGATLEGSADTLIGASLDTMVQGGEFMDNLKQNAMFMGLGYAEFAGPALRGLRNLPPEELHGVAQAVNVASIQRTKLIDLCAGTDLDPKKLLDAGDLPDFLKGMEPAAAAAITETVQSLKDAKQKFEEMFRKAIAASGTETPQSESDHETQESANAADKETDQAATGKPVAKDNHESPTGERAQTESGADESIMGRPSDDVEGKIPQLKKNIGIRWFDTPGVQREKLLNHLAQDPIQMVGTHEISNGNTRYVYAKKLGIPDDQIPVRMSADGPVISLAEWRKMNASTDTNPKATRTEAPSTQGDATSEGEPGRRPDIEEGRQRIKDVKESLANLQRTIDTSEFSVGFRVKFKAWIDGTGNLSSADIRSEMQINPASRDALTALAASARELRDARSAYIDSLGLQKGVAYTLRGETGWTYTDADAAGRLVFEHPQHGKTFIDPEKQTETVKNSGNQIRIDTTPQQEVNAPLAESPEVDLRQRQRPFTPGDEVYIINQNGVPERGWYLKTETDGSRVVYRPNVVPQSTSIMRMPFDPERMMHVYEVEKPNQKPGTMPRHKGLEMLKRKYNFLNKPENLSENLFKKLFEGPLRQSSNVGDCYLIAAFNSIRSSPHFEALMRTSIKPAPNGGYIVKIPLGGPHLRSLFIPSYYLTASQTGHTLLEAVDAADGWKILEAAYMQLRGGGLNRKKLDNGFGDQTLKVLFGDGVDVGVVNNPVGGRLRPLSEATQETRQHITQWLDAFDNGKDIATIDSRFDYPDDTQAYIAQSAHGPIEMYYSHSYSIEAVDRTAKLVIVKNPHDTAHALIFTYDQLLNAFSRINRAEVNFNTLFQS